MENIKKTAIVTGASRGIGKGIAKSLAQRGYNLFITHLDEQDEAESLARELHSAYAIQCEVMQIDLSLKDSAKKTIDQAIESFGTIDVLVNNAGHTIFSKVREMPEENVDYLMSLNYRSPILATKYIAAHMIDHQIRGSIITTASTRAERAYPLDAIYGGMKAALVRSFQSIALELAPHGIRVNTIAPGAIQVRDNPEIYDRLGAMVPIGRIGYPEDVGNAVAWLCSEEASYITGTNLRIDGGLILPGIPEEQDVDPNTRWGKPL